MPADPLAVLDLAGRLVVAGAFGWAAVGKLLDVPSLRATLYLSRLTRPWVPQLTVLLPGSELVLAAGLLGSRAGWVAAAAAAALTVAFIGYLAADRTAGQGCSCFGRHSASTSRGAGIRRDVLLLAALAPALVRGPAAARWGLPWPAVAGLAAVGVAVLVWGVRRGGRGRDATGRRRAGVPPVPPELPAPVRREAPAFDVPAVDGSRLRSVELVTDPGGVLVVFTEPGCVRCDELVPQLADRPDAVVLAAGDPDAVRHWAGAHGLPGARVGIDEGGAVADAYDVPATPAAARIAPNGLLVDVTGAPTARLAVGVEAVRAALPTPR